ncbi:MAG TPA: hypothetical protein VK706_05580 [Candidatus Sulfotelmatobacter sp.]|jgi:hypothetical protein|nr:hypothetical protein [Candidatus Sulfotelmatobacter sp.]
MHRVFGWLLMGVVLIGGYTYYQNRSSRLKAQTSEESQEPEPKPDAQDPVPTTTVLGPVVSPLAEFMEKANPLQKTEDPPPRKPHHSDLIAPSPVGTGTAIVHKTFAVTSTAQFLFQVPPHAASPQLRGTYHSFAKSSGIQSADQDGDIDLLLMNDQQYSDFLSGRPADVVYSVEASHDSDVSLGLPATRDQPVQYYLVFRNSANSPGKKVVQADFRIDF